MTQTGGGQKINLLREQMKTIPSNDLILFVDGYDVIILENLDVIRERYEGFKYDILFAAERQPWPDREFAEKFPPSHTKYRYLNSGAFIGRCGAIKAFLDRDIPNDCDDQLFIQKRFFENHGLSVGLDYEGYIFQCDDDVTIIDGQISNGICCPAIYHGNGGDQAKCRFDNLVQTFGYRQINSSSKIDLSLDYREVAPNILVTPCWSEEKCKEIIRLSDEQGSWSSLEGDKFPAQEIRALQLGMWTEIEALWKEKLAKIAMKHWTPMLHYGVRDAFAMRYSMDTQTSLGFHTDASLVTGSIKLNNDYEGAELIFPHQNFSNKDVKIGDCILFPSMVTHGHKVEPLVSGVKYSFTMWTSRFDGDLN